MCRIVLYADQRSLVDFFEPEQSSLVKELRRVLGKRLDLYTVNSDDVRSGRAFDNNPHVFILPGIFGETSHYPNHIGPQGNEHIRHFVNNGGVFMGFCAGAYYASQSILYTPAWGEHKKRDNTLSLISAQAFGPLPGYCAPVAAPRDSFMEGWHRVDPIAVILKDGERLELAYGFGPAFQVAAGNPHVNVIASYADVDGQPPAIIEGTYGRGRAVLYGALPHYSYDHIRGRRVEESAQPLKDALRTHHVARTAFWDSQVALITQHHGLYI